MLAEWKAAFLDIFKLPDKICIHKGGSLLSISDTNKSIRCIQYYTNGSIYSYVDTKYEGLNKIEYGMCGIMYQKTYTFLDSENNKRQLVTRFNSKGNIDWVEYSMNGKLFREDGPAVIKFYTSGSIQSKTYYTEIGKIHRSDGPAYILYHEDGTVFIELNYNNKIRCHTLVCKN